MVDVDGSSVSACRLLPSTSWLSWSEGRRPSDAESAFIKMNWLNSHCGRDHNKCTVIIDITVITTATNHYRDHHHFWLASLAPVVGSLFWYGYSSNLLTHTHTHTHTHTTVLRPFFRDHPGEPVSEENFWTLWCKGRLTEADTLTIRLGATPSGLTSAHLHHPPYFFYELGVLPAAQPTVSKHWRQN